MNAQAEQTKTLLPHNRKALITLLEQVKSDAIGGTSRDDHQVVGCCDFLSDYVEEGGSK